MSIFILYIKKNPLTKPPCYYRIQINILNIKTFEIKTNPPNNKTPNNKNIQGKQIMTSKIIGTGSYVPAQTVTNDDLAKIVDTNDEWITSRTGIRQRRIVMEEGTSHMAAEAARQALQNAGIKAEELDLILLGTTSPDNAFPSGACEVQGELGAVNACAFDISAACSGFLFALNTMQAFIQSGIYRTGLVIGTDCLSKLVDWKDRGTCVLFGDGAGAAVIQASDTGIIHTTMGSDGSKWQVLSCISRTNGNFLNGNAPKPGYITMDGQEVFKFAVKKVPECIRQVLKESETNIDDIKYFVLHQANYRIIEAAAKRLKQPMDKFPMNMEHYGNTSAASVPILLDEMNRTGRLKSGDKIIMSGFGAGLTWGATLLEW